MDQQTKGSEASHGTLRFAPTGKGNKDENHASLPGNALSRAGTTWLRQILTLLLDLNSALLFHHALMIGNELKCAKNLPLLVIIHHREITGPKRASSSVHAERQRVCEPRAIRVERGGTVPLQPPHQKSMHGFSRQTVVHTSLLTSS